MYLLIQSVGCQAYEQQNAHINWMVMSKASALDSAVTGCSKKFQCASHEDILYHFHWFSHFYASSAAATGTVNCQDEKLTFGFDNGDSRSFCAEHQPSTGKCNQY